MKHFKHIISLAIIFYLNSSIPGRPGEKRILKVAMDSQQFMIQRTRFNPAHSTINVDESDLRNQDDILDVANNLHEKDFRSLEKYYVNNSNQVMRRGGWRPRRFGPYAPTADVQLIFSRSGERAEFDDNFQQMITALGNIAANSTDQEKRTIATILRRYMRFDNRRERPN